MDIIKTDVAIIGAGGGGLRAAIAIAEAHPELEIALISKVYPMRSHTVAAEGGSAGVVRDDDSLENRCTVLSGAARAISIAARKPAPPAPTIATSVWIISIFVLSLLLK